VLNLHPVLPYNKGWNTPSWAILDNTTYGATLHFMTEALDEGDIIHQKKLEIVFADTANTLYQKALELEKEVSMKLMKNC
jgi:methionyl-tRNA formyltransferase